MYNIENILKTNFSKANISDNTKGFILQDGTYLVIRDSHSSSVIALGLTLKEVIDYDILRFGSYDKIAYVEKSDTQSDFTTLQKSVLSDFIYRNDIKKVKINNKIYDLTNNKYRTRFMKIIQKQSQFKPKKWVKDLIDKHKALVDGLKDR